MKQESGYVSMVLHCSIYPSIVWLPFHSESERYLNFNERNEGQRTMSVHRDLFKFPLRFHFMCFFLRFPFVNIIGHNVFTPKPSVCKGLTYFHTYLQCVSVCLCSLPRFIYIMLMVYFYGTLWIIFSI